MEKHRFLLLFTILIFGVVSMYGQQTRRITGVVKDTSGETVIGASISVKDDAAIGTITDLDGVFSLNVPEGVTLLISYIGYKNQEIPVDSKTFFNITLTEDAQLLDEVVVVGYGTMRKKDLTGSIVQIRPEQRVNESPKTVQDILRGTPGLDVGYDASAKGGGSLQIRGQRSVYTDGNHNSPLIILDGMIFYGELSEINPDDIGQVDILKDASAASVYGAKSANGVIIITTKKGKQGKPKVNFNSSIGFVTMGNNNRSVYGPEGYLQYREDWYTAATYATNPETGKYEAYQLRDSKGNIQYPAGYYTNPTPGNLEKYGITLDQWKAYTTNADGVSDKEIFGKRINLQDLTLQNFLAGRTFDWFDHSFRTGINQDYNISISGASENVNYYLSLGYISSEGVAKGNDYSAIRANMKVEGKVNKWLTVGANVNFQDRTDGDLAVNWGSQIGNSPYAQYKDDEGNLLVHPMGSLTNNKGYNYDFEKQYEELEKGYTVLNSIFTAKVTLPFNITYSFNAAPRYQFFYDRHFVSSEHPSRTLDNSQVNREQAKRFDWSLNNTINWDYTFADKHKVNLTLVQEAEERRYWQDRIEARALRPTDALGFHETKVGDKEKSNFDSHDSHETADGMLARLFYAYDDRYMLTTSVRRDGYSAFGTSNPRATFYSVALAWSFTNEKFFKWKPMSMGKLRVSWGENGNRSLANPYIALADLGAGMGATQGYYDTSMNYVQYRYLTTGRLQNRGLRWEKTTAWNVGLDFGFFDNRLTGSVDYYVMPTNDMIMNQPLPDFTGFGSITCNLGEVENKGIEISLSSQNIRNHFMEWNTTFAFSKYKNTIKHLFGTYEMDAYGNMKEQDYIGSGWFIGRPISQIWDYKVTGIWQVDEVEEAAKYGQRPGDPKVENNPNNDEYNEDGTVSKIVYNNDDKEFLGQKTPKIRWSLRNDFTFFKNLSISFNIYSNWGHKSTGTGYMNKDNGTSLITNGLNLYTKEYWTLDNPINNFARLDAKGPSGLGS
ncbi:SusC/RagA family TonB-linked outer membrane protein, partial [Bacteroides sp. OttesenSCG-928-N06]|nr:SusC/RagA family TonB-linked outer membrane protein [Bacteroides sp. OttesenSCG-928-N06]